MTLLEQKLQQLNLSAMTRNLETTIAEAAAKNLSVAATLEWLADMELEARQHRAIDRRFKCARLQVQPSIDGFLFHHHKSRVQAKNRILRLLDLNFLRQGTNIVLIAPDLLDTFPDSEAVNDALRSLKKIATRSAKPAQRQRKTASAAR